MEVLFIVLVSGLTLTITNVYTLPISPVMVETTSSILEMIPSPQAGHYTARLYVADASATGFTQASDSRIVFSIRSGTGTENDLDRFRVGDFNGDGMADLYWITNGIDRVFISDGRGYFLSKDRAVYLCRRS